MTGGCFDSELFQILTECNRKLGESSMPDGVTGVALTREILNENILYDWATEL